MSDKEEPKLVNLAEARDEAKGVREVLEHALSQADGFDGVVVVAVTKDGGQWLRGSSMNQHTKSFLLAFHQAVVQSWFRLRDM